MEPFITGEDIEVKDYLFGREKELETLEALARRHEVAGIIAPRRFGKTCILKTMRTILKEINGDAYPVFFSAHDYAVSNNTDETYSRMATAVATQMCKDGIIKEGDLNLFRKTTIYVSTDEIDTFESFRSLSSERQRESVFKLAELLRSIENPNRYLLLLLDEVDYLLLTAFESPDDFMRLRTAATKKQAAMKFWVAGPASWKSMCNSVGSPGLNCGLQNISLLPLSLQDFKSMWEYECSLITDLKIQKQTQLKVDFAFNKSGGVPFYAKFIGRQYQISSEDIEEPSFMILRDHLKEMFENRFFSQEEIDIMKNLSRHPIDYGDMDPEGVTLLIDKGLARKVGEYTELTVGYLIDYLQAIEVDIPEKNPKIVDNIEQLKINDLVDKIQTLMAYINETYQNKRGNSIFENPESVLDDDKNLRSICHSKSKYGDFLSTVYLMFYERSKAPNSKGSLQPGQRLYELEIELVSPQKYDTLKDSASFYRNREFFKVIETLRAAYNAHIQEKLERQEGQYTIGEALKHLKGDCNPPEPQEWPALQIQMLSLFKKELEHIKTQVRSLSDYR